MAATSFPAEGAYTISARATDGVGLTAIDTRRSPRPDTPTRALHHLRSDRDHHRGNVFTFTGEAGAIFECRVDRARGRPAPVPTRTPGS